MVPDHVAPERFTASELGSLSLHRSALETTREDEDIAHEPDRRGVTPSLDSKPGRSSPHGRGNLRYPDPVRSTACAPAFPEKNVQESLHPASPAFSVPPSG